MLLTFTSIALLSVFSGTLFGLAVSTVIYRARLRSLTELLKVSNELQNRLNDAISSKVLDLDSKVVVQSAQIESLRSTLSAKESNPSNLLNSEIAELKKLVLKIVDSNGESNKAG